MYFKSVTCRPFCYFCVICLQLSSTAMSSTIIWYVFCTSDSILYIFGTYLDWFWTGVLISLEQYVKFWCVYFGIVRLIRFAKSLCSMFVCIHGTYVEVYKVLGLLSIRDIHGPLDKWNQPICIPGFLSVRPILSRFIQYFMSHKLF